jgi:hypothetical protein
MATKRAKREKGRPKVEPERLRSNRVSIGLTDGQLLALDLMGRARGLPVASVVRSILTPAIEQAWLEYEAAGKFRGIAISEKQARARARAARRQLGQKATKSKRG